MASEVKSATASSFASQKLAIPVFINDQNKFWIAVIGVFFFTLPYMLVQKFPLYEPSLLKMTAIDQWIPFIPETFWIYTSEYLLYLAAFFTARSHLNTTRFLVALCALYLTSLVIFYFWPTTYPRDLFPLDASQVDAVTFTAFEIFRNYLDDPSNCAPSLHVSTCYLTSFMFIKEQRRKFLFFFAWATIIGITTMTTKQHYLIDVVLGLVMATSFYFIFDRFVEYYYPASSEPKQSGSKPPQKFEKAG